jgi:hypothetical protein
LQLAERFYPMFEIYERGIEEVTREAVATIQAARALSDHLGTGKKVADSPRSADRNH